MSLQNRVSPDGQICFSSARGTLMGNRGCLHNEMKQIRSNSKRDAWVTCLLSYANKKRPIMAPGQYTELFFLDEATALAAGHRPCATCRRENYNAFLSAWGNANQLAGKPTSAEIDKQMKADRAARVTTQTLLALPTGTIVKAERTGEFFLIKKDRLYKWSFEGYGPSASLSSASGPFIVMTPACTMSAMRCGYAVEIHASANS